MKATNSLSAQHSYSACGPGHKQGRIARESIPPFLKQKGQSMRSNRLHGCVVVAALFAQTSSVSAQDNTDENTDGNTDDNAAPVKTAQAEPSPPPVAERPGSAGPALPGPGTPPTEE